MEKNKNATEDFLDTLNNTPVQEEQEETEVEDLFPEDKEDKEEKRVPFRKDEKIQRYIQKEVEKAKKSLSATETFKEEVGDPKFISSMERIIGTDTPDKVQALKDLKEDWKGLTKQAKQEALRSLQEEAQRIEEQEESELAEAFDELEEGRSDIEAHIGKELTERQWDAYKDFLDSIGPRNGYEQYPDFVKTFEVFRNNLKAQRPSNAQAKVLASRGMERSSSSSEAAPKVIRQGNKSLWQSIEQVRSNL